ncbi:MAG: hypothetical protein KC492_12995, partial [Myxococcales bacterium]|nr:hypothetical protein [Myxococcales bacterium]
MSLASRHAGLLLTALWLFACGAQQAPPAAVITNAPPAPSNADEPEPLPPVWRNSVYDIEVPCSDDEVDNLESHSPGVIYLGSRVVSIATSAPNARAAFQQV